MGRTISVELTVHEEGKDDVYPDSSLLIELPDDSKVDLRRLIGEMAEKGRELLLAEDKEVLQGDLADVTVCSGGTHERWL